MNINKVELTRHASNQYEARVYNGQTGLIEWEFVVSSPGEFANMIHTQNPDAIISLDDPYDDTVYLYWPEELTFLELSDKLHPEILREYVNW